MIATLALCWAIAALLLPAVAWVRARRLWHGEAPSLAAGTRVLVIRPVAGHEPHLADTLASLAEATSSATLGCWIAVERADDPAVPAAEAARALLAAAGIEARVVITAADPALPNRKVAQLAACAAQADACWDAWVGADGDVDLGGADLDRLVAPLGSGVAATWAPPVEAGPVRSVGDRVSRAVLGASLHAFPLLAGLDPRGLVGKLFAVAPGPLRAAGGFEALGAFLGEDMALSRLLAAAGHRVEPVALRARSVASGRPWRQVWERYVRWVLVIRGQRPHLLPSYPLFFAATPLVLGLAAWGGAAAPARAAAAATLAVAGRWLVALAAGRLAGQPAAPLGALRDGLVADLALLGAFARALASRRVRWRGRALEVSHSGRLATAPRRG